MLHWPNLRYPNNAEKHLLSQYSDLSEKSGILQPFLINLDLDFSSLLKVIAHSILLAFYHLIFHSSSLFYVLGLIFRSMNVSFLNSCIVFGFLLDTMVHVLK